MIAGHTYDIWRCPFCVLSDSISREGDSDERGGYKALHGVFSILGSFSGMAVAQREPTRRQTEARIWMGFA